MLSFDAIMAVADLEERTVYIPEWQGEVKVRGTSKAAELAVRKSCTRIVEAPDGTRKVEVDVTQMDTTLLEQCLVDPVLTPEQAAELVRCKAARSVNRILDAIYELNGRNKEELKAAVTDFQATR